MTLSRSDQHHLAAELRYAQRVRGVYIYGSSPLRKRILETYLRERDVVLRRWLTVAKARALVAREVRRMR